MNSLLRYVGSFIGMLLLGMFVTEASARPALIGGRVLDQDGAPMAKAHVSITRPNRLNPITTVETNPDGSYLLQTEERGFVLLQYFGVDHESYTVGALISDTTNTGITVQLQPYSYYKRFDSVRVIGDFNNYSYDAGIPLERNLGCHSVTFATSADSVVYQLTGVAKSGAVSDPGATSFVFDGTEAYRSVAYARDGKVTIVFDSTLLVRSKAKAVAIFEDPAMESVATIYSDIARRRAMYQQGLVNNRLAGKSINEFTHAWGGDLNQIARQIAKEKDTLKRSMLMISYLDLGTLGAAKDLSPAITKQALALISPVSHLWSINPRLIPLTIEQTGQTDSVYQDYLSQAIDEHPDSNVSSMLLYDGLTIAYTNKETVRAQAYYERLTRDYSSSRYAAMARMQFVITHDEEVSAQAR